MPSVTVEIAVDNLHDALAAMRAGADRLEVCSDLAAQGLTASAAVISDFRIESNLPIAAMVRPRGGSFAASPSDHFLAPRQAEAVLAAGADAIVFGFLTPDHTIDTDLVERMVRLAGACETVFHRAFDLLEDPFAGIDQLVELGVTRVLTAGMSPANSAHALGLPAGPYVPDSIDSRLLALRRYADRARGRIEILPCGGVRAGNAARFINEAGAPQLHAACRAPGESRLDVAQVGELLAVARGSTSVPH